MISLTNMKKRGGGFTLLELLIVVSIIAILSVALMYMLNPAEALKKSRDAQRMSDLSTIKAAIGTMLVGTSTPSLDNFGTVCLTNSAGTPNTAAKIRYSTGTVTPYASFGIGADAVSASAFTSGGNAATGVVGSIDGGGWIPAVLSGITGGSPISNYPVDPTNTVSASATSTDLVYRFACQNSSNTAGRPSYVFELDAQLESSAYTVDDNKRVNDGGDNTAYYEIGNSLKLLPAQGSISF